MPNIVESLDELIDVNSLFKLKPLIEYGIVKNWKYTVPTNFVGKIHFKDTSLLSMSDIVNLALENPNNYGDPLFIKKLHDEGLLGPYLRYSTHMHYSGFALGLRVSGYKDKHDKNLCKIMDADYDFAELHSWLEAQNIFESYGRVVIWVHEPGTKILMHRDSVSTDKLDQFIWIRLSERKKLFVEHPETAEKYYLNGYVNWFNTSCYHSSDICEEPTYSIRIDGLFTKKFREYIGL